MARRWHPVGLLLLFAGVFLLLGLTGYWFLLGKTVERADAVRLVAGACLIFLLPGLIAGELMGLRGRSLLETVAVACTLSLTLEIALAAVVFLCATVIQVWVGLLLGMTALGAAVLLAAALHGKRLTFIVGLFRLPAGSGVERALYLACVLAPLVLGLLAYAWGEQAADLGGEKYIHMMFIRYYAEMPLVLDSIGIDRGVPPPNLVHLWEFLLAGWACCVRVDPLPLFAHCRMAVPVLGLAGMYLLIRMVFLDWRKSALVFAGVLLLSIGQVVLEAGNLRWINAVDPTRGVLAFLGTAHHADAALDILLPLTAGIFLLFLRQPRPAHGLLVAGILAANFLWHPREFLQAALYLGMLAPVVVLLPSLRRGVVVKRWLALAGILVAVGLAATAVSRACVSERSHFYDESELKRASLRYALVPKEIATVRSLFHFPLHVFLATTSHTHIVDRAAVDANLLSEWNYDRWWFLAAGATVVLVLLGVSRDRQLAFYHLVFWLLAYCWNFSMFLILALTYSEFYHATPRLLYLFTYLVIADAALVGATAFYHACQRAFPHRGAGWAHAGLAAVGSALLIGFANVLFARWMRDGHRGAWLVAAVLNVSCLALLPAVFWCERPWWNAHYALRTLRRPLPLVLAMVLVAAALWPHNTRTWRCLIAIARSGAVGDPDWFGSNNPLGYSRELVSWARTLPAGTHVATNPSDVAMLSIYAPVYLCVQPVCSVIRDQPERERADQGKHPFYRPLAQTEVGAPSRVDHESALQWLRERRADYVFLNRADYDSPALAYFQAHPEVYELVFENSAAKEAVFLVRGGGEESDQLARAARRTD
jgi:hypothetical protein